MPLTIVTKLSISNVCGVPGYASDHFVMNWDNDKWVKVFKNGISKICGR